MPTKKAALTKKTTVKKAAIKPAAVSKAVDHSHAMLVALAYLIGFVTAYIAFAVNDGTQVIAEKKDRLVTQEAVAYSAVRAVTTEEGLFAATNGHQRVISAQLSEGELSFGYHRTIQTASVSPDCTFIHYCAVMDDANSCQHFIYSTEEDKVYPVVSSGSFVTTSISVADDSIWTNDNGVSIGGQTSVGPDKPWEVE